MLSERVHIASAQHEITFPPAPPWKGKGCCESGADHVVQQ